MNSALISLVIVKKFVCMYISLLIKIYINKFKKPLESLRII